MPSLFSVIVLSSCLPEIPFLQTKLPEIGAFLALGNYGLFAFVTSGQAKCEKRGLKIFKWNCYIAYFHRQNRAIIQ
jgi:hypothetical protein